MKNPPKMFVVNWFRRDEDGRFLWPGFGENIRVLRWIIERTKGIVHAKETPIGLVPMLKGSSALEQEGLNIPFNNLRKVFEVKSDEWKEEINMAEEFFSVFGDKIPEEIRRKLSEMRRRLGGK